MAFVRVEKRIGLTEAKLGASMSMRIYNASPKPMTFIALRKNFLETTKFADARKFDVAVGEGDDAGKIKIAPNPKGPFFGKLLKSAAIIIDIGHLPALGMEEHKNQEAAVELVDGAAIVTVPTWSENETDDDLDDDEEDEAVPPVRAAPRADIAAGPSIPKFIKPERPSGAPKAVMVNGITINLTSGNEAVTYRGEAVDVSPRGAALVELLARAMPNCIGDGFLIGKLWTPKPAGGSASLDMVVRDLASLKKCGLEIRTQRGVGRQLIEVKP